MPSPCPCRGCKAAYEVGYKEGVDSVTLTVVNDMYKKGYTAGHAVGMAEEAQRRDEAYRIGYREGYNAHASSRAYAEQVYGKYPMSKRLGTLDRSSWFNQHGEGENP